MWIEKRKDQLLACERFYNDLTGKMQKISIKIAKDTAQERKKAFLQLTEKWDARQDKHSDLKLFQLGRLYLEDAKDRLKEQTYVRNKSQFKHMSELLGNVLIDKIKAKYVKDKLKASGKRNSTLNGYIRIFKVVMRWAYVNELTDNIAVVDRIQKFPEKTIKQKIQDKFLESEELELLVTGMNEYHWQMLTQWQALTGMRIGETIALNDSDVDLKSRTVNIDKTYIKSLKRTGTPKTLDSIRSIPIQNELLQLAIKIKRYSAETRMITGQRNDIFFCSLKGTYIQYDTYEKYLRENGRAILDRSITAHILRHTFTSIYAEKGLTFEQISRQLGHANSKITKEIYYHVTDGQKAKDAAKIEKISIFAH